MDAYDEMYPRLTWKDHVRPVVCDKGGQLMPENIIAGVVTYRCACGHYIQKSQMEMDLYASSEKELVVPCPQSEPK
jgi:hypothetical protein